MSVTQSTYTTTGSVPAPPATPAALSADAGEPKLRDYLRILGYHWRLLLLVGAMPVIGAALYTVTRPNRYRARTVMVRADGPGSKRSNDDISLRIAVERINRGDPALLNEARTVARKALENADLSWEIPDDGEFARLVSAAPQGRGFELAVTASLAERRDLAGGNRTGRLAAVLADSFAEALVACADRERGRLLQEARAAIQAQMKNKSDDLGAKLREILQRQAELTKGGEILPLPSEIEKVMVRLDGLKREMRSAEFRVRELEEQVAELTSTVRRAGATQPANMQLVELNRKLIEVEMALVQARLKYKGGHPTLQKLEAESQALKSSIERQRSTADRGEAVDTARLQARLDIARAQLTGVRARRATIQKSLEEETHKLSRVISRLEAEGVDEKFARLMRERQVLEASISALQHDLENVSEEDISTSLPRMQVLSRAEAPAGPFSPRWAVNLAVGLGLAMVLAMAVAFISENLEDRIRDQRDLVQHVNLPFLGLVPLWREDEAKLIDLDYPRSITSSVHEVLRNNINYALPPGAPKTLLVASSVQGEGKSTIAANLAISYCLDGNNVLLVDTDLRRPQAHRLFESLCPQAASSCGLTGYLSGQTKLDEALLQANVPGLSIIVAGHGAKNPSKLLGSEDMRALVAQLTTAFDVVILDGPAVLPVVDSTVVSGLASGVLLVVASKRAPAEQIATAVARLQHVRAPLIGVVLNRQPGGFRDYQHYFGSRCGYDAAYTYGSDEAPAT